MEILRQWAASRTVSFLLLTAILLTGGYFYLYPGSQALLEARTDTVMSDGTDSISQPYGYDMLKYMWREHPSRFFYGAIYYEGGDPEKGTALWYPLSDRWLGLLHTFLFPVEQVSTAYVYSLLLINGLCMFLLCTYLSWSRSLSLALSFAWSFNCYVRARAKVHTALAGIYHLPLIFLGLFLVARGKSWRSLVASMAIFLLAGTTAHYYLVTCVFISPIFVLFVLIQPEFRARAKIIGGRFALAVLPLVVFLGLNFYFVVPEGAKITGTESKEYGVVRSTQVDPFLMVYSARAIDYFAGDISLQREQSDLNPLRALINGEILGHLDYGNAHERTNGIRWSILILSVVALVFLLRGRFRDDHARRTNLIFFLGFALFAFWLSLAPDVPALGFSPSYWLYQIFPKIRVPDRAGIMVHFSLLMVTGLLLSHPSRARWQKLLLFPGVLLALMVLDYPPLQEMPMAPVAPAYASLNRDKGPCSVGMVFPFVSSVLAPLPMYYFTQRMRGSDCTSLNALSDPQKLIRISQAFPPKVDFLRTLSTSPQVAENLLRLARCIPLNWFAFFAPTPADWAANICHQLGWQFSADLVCVAPDRNRKMEKFPDDCL